MRRRFAFAFAAFATALVSMPAQAQPVPADLLPAHEVVTIVASMGMRVVGRPAWARGRYVVAAVDRHGRELNVVLDAFDGQVIAVRPIGGRGFAPPPAIAGPGGPLPDEDGIENNERRQASRPPARASRNPSVTGSVRGAPSLRKEAAPMPRPRPALAKANDQAMPASDKSSIGEADAKTPETVPAAAAQPETGPAAKAEAKADTKAHAPAQPESKAAATPQAAKPAPAKGQAKGAAKPDAAKPAAAKPDAASTPESGKREIRVIDLSKPEDTKKPDDKPGEAIRF